MSSNSVVKEFVRRFNKLHDYSRTKSDMFRDMIEMAYCAYAKPTSIPERADALEARYMGIVNRYENKDTIREYASLISLGFDALEVGGCDFLGEVSSELELLDSRHGQFFTPYSVASMMARMNLHDVEQFIERQGYFTIGEPASGAGGMLLAAADVIQRMGYNPMFHMLAQATDVAPMCFHMTFVQMTWRGIPGLVIHGNSLSMKEQERAWTMHTHIFYNQHGHLFDRPETQQLSIFDYALEFAYESV